MATDIFGSGSPINIPPKKSYTARDAYNDEIMGLKVALSRGEVPYGGIQNAFLSIRDNYAIPAGVSMEELTGAVYGAFGQQAPSTPSSKKQSTSGSTGGSSNAPTAAEIAAYNNKVNADFEYAVNQAKRARETQLQKYQDTVDDLALGEKNLGTSRDEGISSNASYFSNISPDAYQSQISRYNTKVQDAYKQGMDTVGKNRDKVGQAKNSYEAEYNDYLASLQRQKSWDISNYGKSQGSYGGFASNTADPYIDAPEMNPQAMAVQYSQYLGGNGQQPVGTGVGGSTWDWLKEQTGKVSPWW